MSKLGEQDDGVFIILYILIDLLVLILDGALVLFMICIEIACWTLAGGFDIILGMLGFKDD